MKILKHQSILPAHLVMTAAVLFSFLMPAVSDAQPGAVRKIDAEDMLKTVTYLASPELGGRRPGSDGYYLAADYMANAFFDLGLKDITGDFFFQRLPVEYVEISGEPSLILQTASGETPLVLGQDFVCRGMTGFGEGEAGVVFCGYGISEPQSGYDDYAGMDVKGKVVMVFKQNPPFMIEGVELSQKYNRYRAQMAAKHGAIALVLVSSPLSKDPQKPIGSIMDGEGEYLLYMPQFHIDLEAADQLFEGSKYSLKEIQSRIDSSHSPASLPLLHKIRFKVEGEYTADRPSMNIIGCLEGSDPQKKQEYVLISAHLDHVGKQGSKLYFPGANDNASGSAAVLQLARAFASLKNKPARSILFVLYTSEEQGLTGSAHFANHCPVPVEQIVAALNMDCIAFGDSIQIGNGKSNPKLWELAREIDSGQDKLSVSRTWAGGGADLEALHKKGVPGLYFVTTNSYAHLHLPSDRPETLNKELYESLVRLVYLVTEKLTSASWQGEKPAE
jgi:hypothetical protein